MADFAQPSTEGGTRRFLARWDQRFQRLQSPIARYGLAIVSVAIALGLSLPLQYYEFRDVAVPILPFPPPTPPGCGGNGPAVTAIVLSALCFDYFFTEPYYSFAI